MFFPNVNSPKELNDNFIFNLPVMPRDLIDDMFSYTNAKKYSTQNIVTFIESSDFKGERLISIFHKYAISEEDTNSRLSYSLKENYESLFSAIRILNADMFSWAIARPFVNKYQEIRQELDRLVAQSGQERLTGAAQLFTVMNFEPQITLSQKKLNSFLTSLSVLCAHIPAKKEYFTLFSLFLPNHLAQAYRKDFFWELFFKNNNPEQASFFMDTFFFNSKSDSLPLYPVVRTILGLLIKNPHWSAEQQQAFFEKYLASLFASTIATIENTLLIKILSKSALCQTHNITDICSDILLGRAYSLQTQELVEIANLLITYTNLKNAQLFIGHLNTTQSLTDQQAVIFINSLLRLFYNNAFTQSKTLPRIANDMLAHQISCLPTQSDVWRHDAAIFLWKTLVLARNAKLFQAILDKIDATQVFEHHDDNTIGSYLIALMTDTQMNCIFWRLAAQSQETNLPIYPRFYELIQKNLFLARVFRQYLTISRKNQELTSFLPKEFYRNRFEFLVLILDTDAIICERSFTYLFPSGLSYEDKSFIKEILQRQARAYLATPNAQRGKNSIFETNCTLIADIVFTPEEIATIRLEPEFTPLMSCYKKGLSMLLTKQKNQMDCPALRIVQLWFEVQKWESLMPAEYAAIHCQRPNIFFTHHASLLLAENKNKRPSNAVAAVTDSRAVRLKKG